MNGEPGAARDFVEYFAEIDLLAALSTCPGGDCGATHSSDTAQCYPLKVEVLRPAEGGLAGWKPHAAEPVSAHAWRTARALKLDVELYHFLRLGLGASIHSCICGSAMIALQ